MLGFEGLFILGGDSVLFIVRCGIKKDCFLKCR